MGIPLTALCPSPTEFHGVIPGQKAEPLGQITLEVIFGALPNYQRELLCFEVVPFQEGYDAILGRTALAEFMAIPCYTYMKLKMSGPYGVITINSDPQRAHEAEADNLIQAKVQLEQRRERIAKGVTPPA